jgi:prolyl 4-hydroxylase
MTAPSAKPIRVDARVGKVTWVDNFLSTGECCQILEELQFAFWSPSGVSYQTPRAAPRNGLSKLRVSETAMEDWFSKPLMRTLTRLDQRLEALIPRFRSRRELWQATRYCRGGSFDYHLDSGNWAHERAGDREHTALIYLDRPRAGGSTHFRELQLDVKPRVGRLLLWRNLTRNRESDREMCHASTPVLAGHKTVLVTWIRQRVHNQGKKT